MKIITEEEIKLIDDECKSLYEHFDPSQYNSVEEMGRACDAITIEEFRQMGINIINEIYGVTCQEK